MEIAEIAKEITIALIARNNLAQGTDAAKWAGDTYKTVLLAIGDAIDEANQ